MSLFHNTITGGTKSVPDVLDGFMEQRPGWVRGSVDADGAPEIVLKGKALDAALEEAGLPTTGKADEKRARLAAHVASITDPAEEQS